VVVTQLEVVTDKHQLRPGRIDRQDEAGQVSGRDHGRLVAHDHLALLQAEPTFTGVEKELGQRLGRYSGLLG
jgi:hypothetical protein